MDAETFGSLLYVVVMVVVIPVMCICVLCWNPRKKEK